MCVITYTNIHYYEYKDSHMHNSYNIKVYTTMICSTKWN